MQIKQMWHLTLRFDVLVKRHSNEYVNEARSQNGKCHFCKTAQERKDWFKILTCKYNCYI